MDDQKSILEDYLQHLRLVRNCSSHTIRAYRQDIGQFFLQIGKKRLETIQKTDIRLYIAALAEKKLRKSTISRKIYALFSFFEYLVQRRVMSANPAETIRAPRIERKLPRILSSEEIETFLDNLPEDDFRQLRDKTIFELLYATGLRVSELTSLRLTDLNFEERMIRVRGKGKKERIVPFHKHARQLLLRYLDRLRQQEPQSEYLFLNLRGTQLTPRSVERILRRSFQQIVNSNRRVYPHLLRHTMATHLLQCGVNLRVIQEILGHENLATTQKYTTLNYEDLLTVHRKFHPRSKAK